MGVLNGEAGGACFIPEATDRTFIFGMGNIYMNTIKRNSDSVQWISIVIVLLVISECYC
jgi:hypothetical protein